MMVACGILLAQGIVGCATVNPQPDFERTVHQIGEQTGADEVYDPSLEDTVESKVTALLADGLTVDEAVRVALLNNRSFQSLFQKVGASRADVVQSGLLTNPSFSLMGQLPEGGGRAKLNVGFGQELVDLWQIPIRKKIAAAQLDETVLDVTDRAVALVAEVKTKYYRLLAALQAEKTAGKTIELLSQSVRLAEERFKVGETSPLDVNLSRSSLLEAKIELLSLQRDRRLAEALLARVMGLSRSTLSWTLKGSLPQPAAIPDDTELIKTAMTQRIDARMVQAQVAAAEQSLRLEYLKVMPSVIVGAELERPDRRALPGRKIMADTARDSIAQGQLTAPKIQSKAERDLERRQIVDSILGPSIQITVPLWDQNQAQIAKAGFKASQKRKEYEDLLDTIADQVQRAAETVRTAQTQVQSYEQEVLPQALSNIDAARRLYQAGEQGILILIESQEMFIKQRRLYEDACRDYGVALAELEQMVGGRLVVMPVQSRPATSQPIAAHRIEDEELVGPIP